MEELTIPSLGVGFSILGLCPLPCRIDFVRPGPVAEVRPFEVVRLFLELALRALETFELSLHCNKLGVFLGEGIPSSLIS